MALRNKEYLRILWEAEDGKDLVHKMQIKRPDVLLMDIRMPEVDGINAIGLLRKEYEDVKIIVLTMYDDQEMISKMMEMGANAYLTKTTDPDEIYQAILTCMNDDFNPDCALNEKTRPPDLPSNGIWHATCPAPADHYPYQLLCG